MSDDREAVARIIDPIAFNQRARWSGMAPNFNVPSAAIREAGEDCERALAKADAILALLSEKRP